MAAVKIPGYFLLKSMSPTAVVSAVPNPMTSSYSKIRRVVREDVSWLKTIIDANKLFPIEMLDGMIAQYFDERSCPDIWLTFEDGSPIAVAFCAPEQMTEGTWNLYLLAVHPDHQGRGIASTMVNYVERTLSERGERLLLVETSGLDTFAQARAFYRSCGFEEEARIREFYQSGDDKIVFRKLLAGPSASQAVRPD